MGCTEEGEWLVRVEEGTSEVRLPASRLEGVRQRSRPAEGPTSGGEAGGSAAVEEESARDMEKKLARVLRLCAAGYLSKGYAQFRASPLADAELAAVRRKLRALHPQPGDVSADGAVTTAEVPTADELPDKPGVMPFETSMKSFSQVFAKPPQERGLALDAVSYEELQQLYHGSPLYKRTLFALVAGINAGRCHPDVAEALGENLLIGLRKPDGGTRPIGIGAALRRLAGRVIMAQQGEEMGRVFTTTAPTADMLEAAGHARDRPCNVPQQLGCGVKGGAEIAVAAVRGALQLQPKWVCVSEDKVNGFNAITRRAIYGGLLKWFPELIPTFRQFYARKGNLYTVGPSGKRLAVDENGDPYWSAEGCAQGDPLGPFFFAIGYHTSLLRTQAAHPDASILCYLDDTYYLQEPDEAHAALLTGEAVSTSECAVRSNRTKQEVYGGAEADMARLPPTLRGAPSAPPDVAKGYAGGRLSCIKVLGAFVGDEAACSARICARVEEALAPLKKAVQVRDTRQINVALQVQHEIVRYCANTSLVYFMRTMGPAAVAAAAGLHDRLVGDALHAILGTGAATPAERSRAARQARLPVKMGGCGLTLQSGILDAACVGSWALVWRPLQQLLPQLFADVNLDEAPQHAFAELRRSRARLMETYARVKGVYSKWDVNYYDYDLDGNGKVRYHPEGLPKEKELVPLARFGTDDDYLKSAQRRYSSVVHHSVWLKLLTDMWGSRDGGRREAIRFIAVSQNGAGAFLNAVPKLKHFRVPTWAMRIECSRRLGLPLMAVAAAGGRRSRHGMVFDALGDVAANDGSGGHQTRHFMINNALYGVLRRVYGGQVAREPANYAGYSDHRPDMTLMLDGDLTVLDLKVFDPVGSRPGEAAVRGGHVAFGNTAEAADAAVLGRCERGERGKPYNRVTGEGHVEGRRGDYARALANGVRCVPLLVETFGGLGPGLWEVLRRAADWRQDKLMSSEYDETTWAARKFMPFAVQQVSVAVHLAMAEEVASALGLAVGADPRAR